MLGLEHRNINQRTSHFFSVLLAPRIFSLSRVASSLHLRGEGYFASILSCVTHYRFLQTIANITATEEEQFTYI